jgi:hypothetical protein
MHASRPPVEQLSDLAAAKERNLFLSWVEFFDVDPPNRRAFVLETVDGT